VITNVILGKVSYPSDLL